MYTICAAIGKVCSATCWVYRASSSTAAKPRPVSLDINIIIILLLHFAHLILYTSRNGTTKRKAKQQQPFFSQANPSVEPAFININHTRIFRRKSPSLQAGDSRAGLPDQPGMPARVNRGRWPNTPNGTEYIQSNQ